MSTDLLDIQEQLRKELQTQRATLPAATAGRISTKNSIFTMPDGTVHDGAMQCIILDSRWANAYFKGAYNPKNIQPPVCSAIGTVEDDMVPSNGSSEPQSESCKTCKHNEWGSAPVGKGKACKNSARLAIVPPNPTEDMTPWILDVAPTGLTNYLNYLHALQDVHGMLALQVVTEIDFAAGVDYPKLTFTPKGPHEHLATAFTLRKVAQGFLNQ